MATNWRNSFPSILVYAKRWFSTEVIDVYDYDNDYDNKLTNEWMKESEGDDDYWLWR